MTCPTCGTPTRVLDTRQDGHHVTRRRICRQEHVTKTVEIAVADRARAKGEQR